MRDMFDVLGVACPMIIFFSVPFLFAAYVRYLRYRETVVLAEQGLVRPRRNGNGHSNQGMLRWGIILTAVGTALCLGLWPLGFMINETPLGFGPWLIPGLIPAFLGLGFIVIHTFGGDNGSTPSVSRPEPEEIPPGKNH